jgi:hypothetical protein
MSDPTFIESWVCIVRKARYEPPYSPTLIIDEAALHRMAATFKGPMPVDVDFRAFEAHSLPVPPSGASIVAVEVRRDERGAYLAGLVRTPHVTFAVKVNSFNTATGASDVIRLVGASFTNNPVLPILRANDPGEETTDESEQPIPGTFGENVIASGTAEPNATPLRRTLLGR